MVPALAVRIFRQLSSISDCLLDQGNHKAFNRAEQRLTSGGAAESFVIICKSV